MRKFRTAALAAATALTVSLAGTSIVSAQEAPVAEGYETGSSDRYENGSSELTELTLNGLSSGEGLGPVGDATDADTPVNATDILGNERDAEAAPQWANLWATIVDLGVVGSLLGGIIAAYNYAVYNGMIPHFIQF
ncbi:hypothetical protein [Corynebacterium lubricantis]|uniref:hypothetical protein n=1 Tax=Corynebacterium lubricantis TaxID=541095 RepID=UPI00037DCCC0|nr:hypothetical protein [Corynebacterium lubricantis]